MSRTDSKRRRHRGRLRRWRPLRWVTLFIGALAMAMGCVFLAWAFRDKNAISRLFGFIYLAVGTFSFLTWALLTTIVRLRGRDKPEIEPLPAEPLPRSSNQSGLALLMALLLMAFLSGIVIQSLLSTHTRLRAAELRRTHLLLRTAALDAAWNGLQTASRTAGPAFTDRTLESRLPSGIATRIVIHPMDRTALPLPFRRVEPPLFGQYFTIAAEAGLGKAASMARGLACRLPSGEVRVLSWWERP